MKIIIAGGRLFSSYAILEKNCNDIISSMNNSDVEIVSGNARGADFYGEMYAKNNKYNLKKFPANWSLYGKSAGYKRNEQMAKYSNMLIAFWDGKSKGTKHMIDLAKKHGLIVHVINY